MSKTFMKIRSGINLGALTADPSDPQNGDVYYNTSSGVLRQYINGAWSNISNTAGTVTSVAASVPSFLSVSGSPITSSGTLAISYSGTALPVANGGTGVTSLGTLSDIGTDGITVTGGTGAVISNISLSQHVADSTHNGYLSSTDWTTFNGKQAAGNYLTALTGDATAAGPGSAALTLATVNLSPGSFTNASITVNAKGLVTAASSGTAPVTALSVVSANGLAGTSSGGTTPALTLSTTITGILQGNGTAISAASTTGSGSVVLATTPTLVTPILGTPTSVTLTNATGLPLSTGVTGTLPIANGGTNNAALAVSAGGVLYTDGTKVVNVGAGTSGQALLSNGSSAPTWGTAGSASPLTTKGDLYGYSTANARIPVGIDGQVLIADSTQSLGVRYKNTQPVNFIVNSDAETGTTGWATYSNTAANTPSSGTGGTATGLTFSASATSPLINTQSFLMVQTNSTSLQGKGVSYDFTIPSAFKAQAIGISFNYNASSTFVASNGTTAPKMDGTTTTNAGNSDIEVFLYDVTNATLIPVTPAVITANGSNNFLFTGSFQTSSTSTSYRLILHVATANANATGWQFKFDNVQVYPSAIAPSSAIVGDWTSFTPTTNGYGTVSSMVAYYRRVGDSVEVQGSFTSGTVAASPARINLPTGLTIDTGKLGTAGQLVGNTTAQQSPGTNNIPQFVPLAYTNSVNYVSATNLSQSASSNNLTEINGSVFATSSIAQSFWFKVPVAGWSTGVSGAGVSTIGVLQTLQYQGNSGQSLTGNVTDIPFSTLIYDTTSSWSSPTFTAPTSGYYNVQGAVYSASATAFGVRAWVNAVSNIYLAQVQTATGQIVTFRGQLKLTAGDTLTVRSDASITLNSGLAAAHWINITQVNAPATTSASQKLAPTVQKFTSGSGTYTTPTSPFPLYLKVKVIGGGGGGAGSGTTTPAGNNGNNSTFGSSLLVAGAGNGAGANGAYGTGGTTSLGAASGTAITGSTGGGGQYSGASTPQLSGGSGGSTPYFNGAGTNAITVGGGGSALANSGSGGAGGAAGGTSNIYSGGGGGSGGFVEAIIYNPASTYAYVVGAGGNGGSAGTSGFTGGAGGSGYIEVTEFYQ